MHTLIDTSQANREKRGKHTCRRDLTISLCHEFGAVETSLKREGATVDRKKKPETETRKRFHTRCEWVAVRRLWWTKDCYTAAVIKMVSPLPTIDSLGLFIAPTAAAFSVKIQLSCSESGKQETDLDRRQKTTCHTNNATLRRYTHRSPCGGCWTRLCYTSAVTEVVRPARLLSYNNAEHRTKLQKPARAN